MCIYAKVDSLVAENENLKQCNDENGLTKRKTLVNGLNSPSHGPEESTVANSLSYAQAAAVPKSNTSTSNSEQFHPLP